MGQSTCRDSVGLPSLAFKCSIAVGPAFLAKLIIIRLIQSLFHRLLPANTLSTYGSIPAHGVLYVKKGCMQLLLRDPRRIHAAPLSKKRMEIPRLMSKHLISSNPAMADMS